MSERLYVIGSVNDPHKPGMVRRTITLLADQEDIPFGIWRDIGRLAGKSYSHGVNRERFEFLVPEGFSKAIEILKGGLWKEKDI